MSDIFESSLESAMNASDWLGIGVSDLKAGIRLNIQMRTHKKKRINKKWLKRYGYVSWTAPSDMFKDKKTIANHIYDVLRMAREHKGTIIEEL